MQTGRIEDEDFGDSQLVVALSDEEDDHCVEKMMKLEKRMTTPLRPTKLPLKFTANATQPGTSAYRRIDATMLLDTQPTDCDDETRSLPGITNDKDVNVVGNVKSKEQKKGDGDAETGKKTTGDGSAEPGEKKPSDKKPTTQQLIQGRHFLQFVHSYLYTLRGISFNFREM